VESLTEALVYSTFFSIPSARGGRALQKRSAPLRPALVRHLPANEHSEETIGVNNGQRVQVLGCGGNRVKSEHIDWPSCTHGHTPEQRAGGTNSRLSSTVDGGSSQEHEAGMPLPDTRLVTDFRKCITNTTKYVYLYTGSRLVAYQSHRIASSHPISHRRQSSRGERNRQRASPLSLPTPPPLPPPPAPAAPPPPSSPSRWSVVPAATLPSL